jgi:Transaldolase/Fructose-6-phosphate aldolase
MNATAPAQLHELGQSLWLDNITRDLLTSGTLQRYIEELSITGLTSNPTIFDHAITNSHAYDAAIREKMQAGKSGEELFFELAIEDLTQAADLFGPIYEETDGVDGGSPSKSHPCSHMTRRVRSLRLRSCMPGRDAPTSSSRSLGRRKDCLRSGKRFSRGFRST